MKLRRGAYRRMWMGCHESNGKRYYRIGNTKYSLVVRTIMESNRPTPLERHVFISLPMSQWHEGYLYGRWGLCKCSSV